MEELLLKFLLINFLLNKLFKRYNVISIHRPFTIYENPKLLRILQIEFSEINDIESFITDLGKIKEIEYAEKIPIDKICWTPNETLYIALISTEEICDGI